MSPIVTHAAPIQAGLGNIFLWMLVLSAVLWVLRFTALRLHRRWNTIIPDVTSVPKNVEDADLVAVLTAAAMAILHKPVTLRRIRFLSGSANSSWAVTGRLGVMASHLITKRNPQS